MTFEMTPCDRSIALGRSLQASALFRALGAEFNGAEFNPAMDEWRFPAIGLRYAMPLDGGGVSGRGGLYFDHYRGRTWFEGVKTFGDLVDLLVFIKGESKDGQEKK